MPGGLTLLRERIKQGKSKRGSAFTHWIVALLESIAERHKRTGYFNLLNVCWAMLINTSNFIDPAFTYL